MGPFEFELSQLVALIRSGEEGEVIGRAEYINGEPAYLLRYRAADGRQVEQWWAESAIASQ